MKIIFKPMRRVLEGGIYNWSNYVGLEKGMYVEEVYIDDHTDAGPAFEPMKNQRGICMHDCPVGTNGTVTVYTRNGYDQFFYTQEILITPKKL